MQARGRHASVPALCFCGTADLSQTVTTGTGSGIPADVMGVCLCACLVQGDIGVGEDM